MSNRRLGGGGGVGGGDGRGRTREGRKDRGDEVSNVQAQGIGTTISPKNYDKNITQ